jgi:hypothetical protein
MRLFHCPHPLGPPLPQRNAGEGERVARGLRPCAGITPFFHDEAMQHPTGIHKVGEGVEDEGDRWRPSEAIRSFSRRTILC